MALYDRYHDEWIFPEIVKAITGFDVNSGENMVKGDVNNDGTFNIADIVIMQKWLLAVPDAHLVNWKAGDLCEDGRLNVFDLCLMKRKLIEQQ